MSQQHTTGDALSSCYQLFEDSTRSHILTREIYGKLSERGPTGKTLDCSNKLNKNKPSGQKRHWLMQISKQTETNFHVGTPMHFLILGVKSNKTKLNSKGSSTNSANLCKMPVETNCHYFNFTKLYTMS